MAAREEPLPPLLSSPVFSKKEGFKSLSKDKKKVGLEGGSRTDHTADVPGGHGKKPGVAKQDEPWKLSISGWQVFNILGHFGSTKEQKEDGTYSELGAFAAKMEVLGIEIEPDAGKFSINLVKLESSLSVLAGRADVDDQIRAELREAQEKGSYVGKLFSAAGPFAARIGDPTVHGDLLTGKGSPNVLIGDRPAMRAGIDYHKCSLQTGGAPHLGGLAAGEPSVVINGFPAVRAGDVITEPTGGPNPVANGDTSVKIGLPAPPVWCWAPAPPPEPGSWESYIEFFGTAQGDVGYWKGEAVAAVEAGYDGFSGKLGGGARASVLHEEFAGGAKIKLPGGYSVTIGGVASGDLLSAGAKAEGKAVIGGEKTFIGLSGELGAGVGFAGVGVKLVLAVEKTQKPEAKGKAKGKS